MRIRAAYESLGLGPVMVRVSNRSYTAHPFPSEFEQPEFRNVTGFNQLLGAIRACWAACFDFHTLMNASGDARVEQVAAPVLSVQRMLSADTAGLVYSQDALGPRTDILRIEAVYGLADPLLHGQAAPDVYYVDRSSQRVLAFTVAPQAHLLQMRRSGRARAWTSAYTPVLSGKSRRKLSDTQAQGLARMALRLERQYDRPHVMEWAMADGQAFVLQAWLSEGHSSSMGRPVSSRLFGRAVGA